MYFNTHTHRTDVPAGTAVVSRSLGMSAEAWNPQPGMLYSVGWHPWYLPADWRMQTAALRTLLHHPQVVAVGECGLDRLCTTPLDEQKAAFSVQVRLAAECGLPLIIHCVRAADILLRLRKETGGAGCWIVHGFRGRPILARQLLQAGMGLSFGLHYHPDSVRLCPADRFFVETDEAPDAVLPGLYARFATLRGCTEAALGEGFRRCFFADAAKK